MHLPLVIDPHSAGKSLLKIETTSGNNWENSSLLMDKYSMRTSWRSILNIAAIITWFVTFIGALNIYVLGLAQRLTIDSVLIQSELARLGVGNFVFSPFREFLVVLTYAGIASVLFWYSSKEWIILYTSFMLILIGPLNAYLVKTPWLILVNYPYLGTTLRTATIVGYLMLIAFFFIFPSGEFKPRWTAWLLLFVLWVGMVWGFKSQGPLDLNLVYLPILIPLFLGLIGLQIYRYNTYYSPTQRQQTQWVLFGLSVSVIALFQIIFIVTEQSGNSGLSQVGQTILLLAVILIPMTFSVAITRYRLFDIQFYISRALLYGLLIAVSVGGYALIVGLFSQYLEGYDTAIAVVATGAIAVLFQPLRQWLEEKINGYFYGKRNDPYHVVSQLGEQLNSSADLDEILTSIVGIIHEMLRLPYVAIQLSIPGNQYEITKGQQQAIIAQYPISYEKQTLGTLGISPRQGENKVSEVDQALLRQLARQAGLAIQNILYIHDLRLAREKLVQSREDERKLIRRDLHDDLAPTLAGLSLMIETLTDQIKTNPNHAIRTAHTLEGKLQKTVRSIRELAYNLRPPALDHFGLLPAIDGLLDNVMNSGVRISRIFPTDMPPLANALEVAIYKIIRECLLNIERHADAENVHFVMNCDDQLTIKIEDDGNGFDIENPRGVGLQTIVDRAEEMGGQVYITSVIGQGTTMRVRMPIILVGKDG